MAADNIMAMPIIREAIMMAREMFWSSSISLRMEKGVTLTIIQNERAKIISPMRLKTIDISMGRANIWKEKLLGSVAGMFSGIICLLHSQSARNGTNGNRLAIAVHWKGQPVGRKWWVPSPSNPSVNSLTTNRLPHRNIDMLTWPITISELMNRLTA